MNRNIIMCLGILIVLIFLAILNNEDQLRESASKYINVLNDNKDYDKEGLAKLTKILDIKSNDNDLAIIYKATNYFNSFKYVYNKKIPNPSQLMNAKEGDCKGFSLTLASLLLYHKKDVYLVIRDSFNDGKETRVGHLYLGLKRTGDIFTANKIIKAQKTDNFNYIPYEVTPYDRTKDKFVNPFLRAEKTIIDIDGEPVRTVVFPIKG